MSKNGKDTKHTINISRRMHFVIDGEERNGLREVFTYNTLELIMLGKKNLILD